MYEDEEQIIAAHAANTHRPAPHQVQQWHDAIDQAAALEQGRTARDERKSGSVFLWGGAITMALIVGIVIGLRVPTTSPPESTLVNVQETNPATPIAFTRGLSLHLQESQEEISRFDSSSDDAHLIRSIVEQNRVFEAAADQHGADDLARVLRAFEPILLRLAAEDIAPADANALRQQLEFELKVMLTKLSQKSSEQLHSTRT